MELLAFLGGVVFSLALVAIGFALSRFNHADKPVGVPGVGPVFIKREKPKKKPVILDDKKAWLKEQEQD